MLCSDRYVINNIYTKCLCNLKSLYCLWFFAIKVYSANIEICSIIHFTVTTICYVITQGFNKVYNVINTILRPTWDTWEPRWKTHCRILQHSTYCFLSNELFVCSQKITCISSTIRYWCNLTNIRISCFYSEVITTISQVICPSNNN